MDWWKSNTLIDLVKYSKRGDIGSVRWVIRKHKYVLENIEVYRKALLECRNSAIINLLIQAKTDIPSLKDLFYQACSRDDAILAKTAYEALESFHTAIDLVELFKESCARGHTNIVKFCNAQIFKEERYQWDDSFHEDVIDDVIGARLPLEPEQSSELEKRNCSTPPMLCAPKKFENVTSDDTYAMFKFACKSGYLDIAKYLLLNMGEVTCVINKDPECFIQSCSRGHIKVAKWLNIRYRTVPIETLAEAFIKTCRNGYLTAAKWLFSLDRYEKQVINEAKRLATICGHQCVVMWLNEQIINSKKISNEKCSICLEPPLDAAVMECNHVYCKECIGKWRRDHLTCPLCRANLKIVQFV